MDMALTDAGANETNLFQKEYKNMLTTLIDRDPTYRKVADQTILTLNYSSKTIANLIVDCYEWAA